MVNGIIFLENVLSTQFCATKVAILAEFAKHNITRLIVIRVFNAHLGRNNSPNDLGL